MTHVQKGFTLIELVMVIAILGFLSAAALPKFQDFQLETRIAATKADLGVIRSALAIRYAQSVAAGSVAAFPGAPGGGLALGAADFADGQIPRNPIFGNTNNTRGIDLLVNPPANGFISDSNFDAGYWYVAEGVNAGRAGAYSNGAVDTSSF